MRVAVAGASGLVGSALLHHLASREWEVARLVRGRVDAKASAISWDPAAGTLDSGALEGVDAVVCLSGASIAGGRWTAKRKAKILSSRVDTVSLLCRTMAAMESPPKVFVCASATGYYGANPGDEPCPENHPRGDDFLSEVCVAWEDAALPAKEKGIRVVHLRFGMVLSGHGGAVGTMLIPFRVGLGGVLGSGKQNVSWIGRDELVQLIEYAIETDDLEGPVNAVNPAIATNREFTKALGRALGRPTILPMPAFAVRLALGEMGEALLLGSTKAVPAVLEARSFPFLCKSVGGALSHFVR